MLNDVMETMDNIKDKMDEALDSLSDINGDIGVVLSKIEDIIIKCDTSYFETVDEVADELRDIAKILEDI
jgi:uncharacterized protein YoxC